MDLDTTDNTETRKDVDASALQSARLAASYIPFLTTSDLLPPRLPSKDELEGVLLDLRKKALMEQYFDE